MVGGKDDAISRGKYLVAEFNALPVSAMLVRYFWNIWIVVLHLRSLMRHKAHHFERGAFARIVDVWLVGDAQEEDRRAIHRLLMPVEGKGDFIHHAIGLKVIDLAGRIDHREVEVEPLGDILEVERIKWDAVSTNPRPRIESLEAIGLGFGCLDHFPDIDLHFPRKERKLIDERNVHEPVGVLEDLHHLGRARRAHGVQILDRLAIEREGNLLRLLPETSDNLRRIVSLVGFVAGIHTLGAKAEPEIYPFFHPRLALNDRFHELLGGGGIGRTLETDERPPMHVPANVDTCALDIAHIGLLELVQRRGHADDDGIALGDASKINGRRKVSLLHKPGKLRVIHVADVVATLVDRLGLLLALLKAQDRNPFARKAHRQGKAHVAEADNADFYRILFDFLKKLFR